MVLLSKIYTRTGDAGTTGLVGGARVAKSDRRIAAIGDVDEANCAIGVALCHLGDGPEREMVVRIQNEMFDLGADLATPGEDFAPSDMTLRIVPGQVERLEQEIDHMNEGLAPLRSFILPGGLIGAAELHRARATVRRAERTAVAAAAAMPLNPQALAYLNRLSDHLFVLARLLNTAAAGDVLWQPGATR
ncbi:cob(I)yrinic acid a,c-diamide adenosyltransferase [Sphingomonas nostoxanthinifaciens]|uniref:cob(I)yrinic acid a,c-diamide adenosyltransferase n=1 Tax=Sphingomonas nostoxanthinifaciens TaxID=2872652 RepID=UPI001CC1D668|nr:cob(I)yrinic acid a,c-diamide adenosyltransferase [Sphingomonas nostoxanthinifaciens]UAK24867.1 cob(I)yrinic acid a,c-diamide adenosyltransferase [Sphingomonas nostoxanthinifaciens]